MDELAYKSSNTRKANQFSWKIIHNTIYTEDYTQYNLYRRLYTIQFIQKIIHNTIYTENYTQYNLYRSKIEKKIGSMNGLCHFFYILELKLGNIYFTTVVIQQNHISVKKITWFSAKHAPLNFFTV